MQLKFNKYFIFALFFLVCIPSAYAACKIPADFSPGNNFVLTDTTLCDGVTYTDIFFTLAQNWITFDCNNSYITSSTVTPAFKLTGSNINLINCDISDHTGRVIDMMTWDNTLSNIQVHSGEYGVYLGAFADKNSMDNLFINNTDYGVYIAGGDENNLSNSIFDNMINYSYVETSGCNQNNIWLNHFWDKPPNAYSIVASSSLCVDTGGGVMEGNFYEENIPEEDIIPSPFECGQISSTNLTTYNVYNDMLSFNWSRQSHISSPQFKYFIDLSNNSGMSWSNIGSTTDTNFSFDTDNYNDGPNQMLRIRPFDGYYNGTPFYTSMFGIGKDSSLLGYTYFCREDATEPGQKVANVTIISLGTPFKTRSDENGTFNLSYIPPGIHKIVAFKEGYMSRWNLTVDVNPGAIENADFELCPIEKSCQSDCTLVGSNRCEPTCDGIAGCIFNFEDNCENLAKGTKVEHNSTHKAICCEHNYKYSLFAPAVDINVTATDIVTLTRIINFRDQFKYIVGAKMKIVVFDKK